MRPARPGTVEVAIRCDTRKSVEAMQEIEHAFQRMGVNAGEAMAWMGQVLVGRRWRLAPSAQAFAERRERLNRRQAAERFALLERHGRDVRVVTGADGVSRVRVVRP